MYDYIVVGAGLSGSITARYLAEEKNKKVLVMDKRNHIGGNAYDYINDEGILVQKYGPHIFHTNNDKVMKYLEKWGTWKPFNLKCMVYMNEKYTPSPFNFQTIDDYFTEEKAQSIKTHLKEQFPGRESATIVEMLENDDEVVKEYAQFLFDNDYSLYTAKQWGIDPKEIDISVLKRVPVLLSYETGYFSDTYQAMPEGGFTTVIKNILDHSNIDVVLNRNVMEDIGIDRLAGLIKYKGESIPMIYTGALDELLDYQFGRLPYRTLEFEWKTVETDSYQDAPVVAYPQEAGYTRITEYKKLPVQQVAGKSTIAVEYPVKVSEDAEVEPYYPIPTESSEKAYAQYKNAVEGITNLYLCGRLAEYKYYNMDQVIERALELCDRF